MNNKRIFIDESGSSSNNIIICFVVFLGIDCVEKVDNIINGFKYKVNKQNSELHFNKESFGLKRGFFKYLPSNKFYIKYSTYRNNKLSNTNLIIKSFIENKSLIENSIIFIDGSKNIKNNRKIITSIKKELKRYNVYIKSIKYVDSKNSNLIQLADMCAGCIRRKFEKNSKEDNELFNLIKPHIR